MRRAIKWITSSELAILLLASPLFLFPRASFSPVLLLLPLLWLARHQSRGYLIPRTPVDWPILGLLVMVFVSIWVTPDLALSLNRIAGLLFGIAVFYALVDWKHRRRRVVHLAWGLVGAGCAVAGIGSIGVQWSAKFPALRAVYSHLPPVIRGVPGAEIGFNANQVAGTLIMVLPLQFCLLAGYAWASEGRKAGRWLAVVGLALSLIITGGMIVLLQSRAALAALALAMVALGVIAIRRARIPLAILASVALLSVAVLGPTEIARKWLTGGNEVAGVRPLKWDARAEIWWRGVWVIGDFPLTGPGMNVFRELVPFIYPTFLYPHASSLAHAHNIYLQAAIDLGIPGLICFLAIMGGVLSAGWQALCYAKGHVTRAILFGTMGGLIAFALWGTVDAISLGAKPGFVWWAVAASTIAAWRDASVTSAIPSPGGSE